MIKHPILLSTILLIASGCDMNWDSANCVKGTGGTQRKALDVAAFTGIVSEGAIDVVIEKGDVQHVEVEGQPELIALVGTNVSNGVWHISTSKCYNTSEVFTVYITTTSLNNISVEGSGNVRSADIFGTGHTTLSSEGSGDIEIEAINDKVIEIALQGSGNVTLSGTCSELTASVEGSGDMRGKGLNANEARIEVEGSGSAEITAISKLNAQVQGSGDVRYLGKPAVTSNIEGSGSVAPIE